MFTFAIIDSDRDFINSLSNFMTKNLPEFKMHSTFTTMESAVTNLRNHYMDLIITEADSSGIDGIEIVKILKSEHNPANFIILSKEKSFEAATEAVRLGVFDYLTKPLDNKEFLSSIARLERTLVPKLPGEKHSEKDVRPMSDRLFSDLLAGRINNPVDLSIRLREAGLEDDYIHRECALVNIHINSFSRWLAMCWDSGAGNFYQTLATAFPKSTDKVEFIFTRVFYSNIEIMCINNSQTPITKLIENYIPEFSDLIMKTFGIYSEIHIARTFSSVSEIMKYNLQEPVKLEIQSEEVVENAVKFIRHNYFRDITLEDVSNYVMLSREYFCSYYKQKTGENFIDTLNKHRIESSKRLLVNTTLTVEQVAESVGYRSVSYFHKTFKNLCGISPSEYRKQNIIKQK